jgi:hypothetical protein
MHPNVKNLIGRRFGNLEVLERAGTTRGRSVVWRCLCHLCGKAANVTSIALLHDRTRSCGCLPPPNRLPTGVSAFNTLVRRYRNDARRSGREWVLSNDECLRLFQSPCHYCGVSPQQVSGDAKRNNGTFTYNGIDRRDHNRGYCPDNVVSCCVVCNRAKLERSEEEFIEWVLRVVNHLGHRTQCKHIAGLLALQRAGKLS